MLPSETMIWQPEFTDKTLSRKPGAVQLMVGLTLIFTVFGVVSLLIFILLSVSPEHRLIISGGASAVFLVIALFFVIFIKQKTAGSRILSETRKQLSEDLNCLKRDDE
ncbi:phage holin family protein [Escherichia coli]|uniref:phage holin family protein n=1 Tax=Escherichia coli TaxID=562 RepID=UPI00325AA55C